MKQVIESLKPKIYKIRTDIYLLSRNKLTFVSLVFIVLLVVLAILAPYIVPYPKHISDAANVAFKLTAPCQEYLFGTDELGRDIFRTISGNPRQFNYRDESAGVCISAQCK